MNDKLNALRRLGRQRQQTDWHGYNNIGDFHDGAYDSEDVSPYSRTAGNTKADIMILLQDWASAEWLAGPFDSELSRLGYKPQLPTNRNLVALLQSYFGLGLQDVFGTNVFPFIKPGGMSTRIPARDMQAAARQFALPQIRIVQPRLAVALGLPAFNALRRAADLKPVQTLAEGIDHPFTYDRTVIWCQAHTGALGRNNRNRGGVDRVNADWARLAASLTAS